MSSSQPSKLDDDENGIERDACIVVTVEAARRGATSINSYP
jgi:hypothetical protein